MQPFGFRGTSQRTVQAKEVRGIASNRHAPVNNLNFSATANLQ